MEMKRREFLYVAGGAAAGIAGWVLISASDRPRSRGSSSPSGFCPRLAEDVAVREVEGGGELLRPDEKGVPRVVCQVNEHGLRVVAGLDGTRTVGDLAAGLGAGADAAGQVETGVASFLALLAQAGLLAEPFYVNIYAAQVTT